MRHILAVWIGWIVLVAPLDAGAELRVQLVSAEEVFDRAQPKSEYELLFVSQRGRELQLTLDPTRIEITNPAAGSRFHPIEESMARRALLEMGQLPDASGQVWVYLLPGMPGEMSSFAASGEVFLAPGLAAWDERTAAGTLVHELGHALQQIHLPGRKGDGWQHYLWLRGIDDTSRFHAHAVHRDRPAEIFAEDFRMLYGGPHATSSASLENPMLVLPDEVIGLREFFDSVLSGVWTPRPPPLHAQNRPNPFNPRTVLHLELEESLLDSGEPVEITVYDTRGRQVRFLGTHPARAILQIPFDGRDDAGRPLASGQYLYRVRVGGNSVSHTMLLLK